VIALRKVPPLREWYPEFAGEFEQTKAPSVISKATPEPPPEPKACQERPEGWWRESPKSEWIVDRGREPTAYELLHDFIIGKTFLASQAVTIASTPPSRLILFEIKHPVRGMEFARLFMSPTDVMDGASDEEPDLVVRMDYYEFAAILCGEVPLLNGVYEGRCQVIGNITAGLDLYDITEATHGRTPAPDNQTPIPRPKMWPLGHP
jgi:hypothetical protein